MKLLIDPYQILGVPLDADQEAIHAAFRRLAMRHHPDRATIDQDPEVFKRINQAYQILSDERRRAVYDHTGLDDQSMNEKEARRAAAIMTLVEIIVESLETDDGSTDSRKSIAEMIRSATAEQVKQRDALSVKIGRLGLAASRWRPRGGDRNPVEMAAQNKIDGMKEQLEELGKTIELGDEMIKIVAEEWEYIFAPPRAGPGWFTRIS